MNTHRVSAARITAPSTTTPAMVVPVFKTALPAASAGGRGKWAKARVACLCVVVELS